MALARKLYRHCKVWAEVDEAGRLVDRNGLVQIRYRKDDEQTYSAKVAEVSELDESSAQRPDASVARTRDAEGGQRGRARGSARRRAGRTGAAAAGSGEAVVIHTDGSCFGNPGPAGIGVLLEWKGATKEISRYLGEGTNNIAELTAIRVALEQVKNRRLPVRVHTDSAYAIGVLSEGWRVNENRELVASIQALMREFTDLRLIKVRGHAGDPRNERVDQLARDAIIRRA